MIPRILKRIPRLIPRIVPRVEQVEKVPEYIKERIAMQELKILKSETRVVPEKVTIEDIFYRIDAGLMKTAPGEFDATPKNQLMSWSSTTYDR